MKQKSFVKKKPNCILYLHNIPLLNWLVL